MNNGWLVSAFGLVWILFGAVLAVSDVRAWKRRVIVHVNCKSLNYESGGVVRHLLQRSTVGHEEPLVLFRAKEVRIEVGATALISYDLKRPHQVFIASEHPQVEHARAVTMATVIGLLPILVVLFSRF